MVTLGSRGAVVVSAGGGEGGPGEPVHVPAPKVAEPVDTTGAGDAFVGALAYFMHTRPDLPLEEAVRRKV